MVDTVKTAADAAPAKGVLRDALATDAPEPLRLISGIVTSHSTLGVPYTVTVRIPDGATTPPLPYPAWWVPRVGDVVTMFYAGGVFTVHGAVAPAQTHVYPHRHAAVDIDGTVLPPAPPAPPVPTAPTAPPSVRNVGVPAVDWGSWGGQASNGSAMIQGGPTNDAFWFYGNGIAAAKGSGTIIGGSIYIERVSSAHGVNGAANVRLGTHGYTARPGAGGGIANVAVVGALAKGQGATLALTAAQIAALNAGHKGLGLLHGGTSYTSADYLRATVGGASGQLSLSIQG